MTPHSVVRSSPLLLDICNDTCQHLAMQTPPETCSGSLHRSCPHRRPVTEMYNRSCPHRSPVTEMCNRSCPHRSPVTEMCNRSCPHRSPLTEICNWSCPHRSWLTNGPLIHGCATTNPIPQRNQPQVKQSTINVWGNVKLQLKVTSDKTHVQIYISTSSLTASISLRAFQCSFGASMPTVVWMVRLSRLVHTRKFSSFSSATYFAKALANYNRGQHCQIGVALSEY